MRKASLAVVLCDTGTKEGLESYNDEGDDYDGGWLWLLVTAPKQSTSTNGMIGYEVLH